MPSSNIVSSSDLLRHEFLQAPKASIVNGEILQVVNRVVKVFGTGTNMAACSREGPSDILQRLLKKDVLSFRSNPGT